VFNYQLNPELSTTFCYQNYQIRVKNCAAIYHQWVNNRIVLDAWYQLTRWGKKRKWNKLSTSWNLPSSEKKTLWRLCDGSISCRSTSV